MFDPCIAHHISRNKKHLTRQVLFFTRLVCARLDSASKLSCVNVIHTNLYFSSRFFHQFQVYFVDGWSGRFERGLLHENSPFALDFQTAALTYCDGFLTS